MAQISAEQVLEFLAGAEDQYDVERIVAAAQGQLKRLKQLPCHPDKPRVLDTFSSFGRAECDFSATAAQYIDERNLCACRRLDVSFSKLTALNTALLGNLEQLSAWGCGIAQLDSRPLKKLRELNVQTPALTALLLGGEQLEQDAGEVNAQNALLNRSDMCQLCQNQANKPNSRQVVAPRCLTALRLRGARVSTLCTALLPNLQVLNIENTCISNLDTAATPALRELWAAGAPLAALDTRFLRHLTALGVSCTSISHIDCRPLAALTTLRAAGKTGNQAHLHAKHAGCRFFDLSGCQLLKEVNLTGAGVRYLPKRRARSVVMGFKQSQVGGQPSSWRTSSQQVLSCQAGADAAKTADGAPGKPFEGELNASGQKSGQERLQGQPGAPFQLPPEERALAEFEDPLRGFAKEPGQGPAKESIQGPSKESTQGSPAPHPVCLVIIQSTQIAYADARASDFVAAFSTGPRQFTASAEFVGYGAFEEDEENEERPENEPR